jgi:hypothetical protein
MIFEVMYTLRIKVMADIITEPTKREVQKHLVKENLVFILTFFQ